jgi:meso-butanediol dehydrogenase/(S,S)-butanediol dehydrogenase/diacetyl reductase
MIDVAMGVLDGKVAIVTGAAGGIGGAVVAEFERAGARVVGLDREQADLTQAGEVQAVVARALEEHGRLDVLFNGAGISGRPLGDGPVHEASEAAWDAVLAANLKTVFLVSKSALPALLRSRGAIVNLASVLGLVGGDDDFATHAYAASKGGVIALTRAMAATYAAHGVRCNAIAPALIATPMSARAQNDPRIRSRLPELQPLTGDFGQPRDVATAALFLASDAARFVTGVVLPVDGGWTAR